MNSKIFSWNKILAFGILYTIGVIAIQILVAIFVVFVVPLDDSSINSFEFLVINSWVGVFYSVFISFLFLFFVDKLNWRETWLFQKPVKFIFSSLSGIVIIGVFIAIYLIFVKHFSLIEFSLRQPNKIFVLFLFSVFSALTEEVPLRGYILHYFHKHGKSIQGIIFITLIFVLLHLLNPGITVVIFINMILFSVFLSFMTILTKSIWFAVFFHLSINFFGSLLFGVGNLEIENNYSLLELNYLDSSVFLHGGESTISGSIVFSILLFISILIVGTFLIKKKEIVAEVN